MGIGMQVFNAAARDAFSNAIRDSANILGNAFKEAVHTINSDSLQQCAVGSAKQLADGVRDGTATLGQALKKSLQTLNSEALHLAAVDSAKQLADGVRDGTVSLGNAIKEAVHTINNDTLHQASVDAARELGDSVGSSVKEVVDMFYFPILFLLLSMSAFFIAVAVQCSVQAASWHRKVAQGKILIFSEKAGPLIKEQPHYSGRSPIRFVSHSKEKLDPQWNFHSLH